jgi:hypothetical protein
LAQGGNDPVDVTHAGPMNTDRRTAVAVLAGAGLLWGTSVPLTKLAL